MSRTDDYGLSDAGRERQDRSPSVQDRAADLSSRLGVSREAARIEMERFRGVAEYETRKIFGQRSALRQPVEVATPQTATVKKRKPAPSRTATSSVRHEGSVRDSAAGVPRPDDSPDRPSSSNDQAHSR